MKGLRKDNAAGNFGDKILRPNCWYVTKASLQSILDNWVVSQDLRNGMLKERVDSKVRGQVMGVRTQMQSFNVFFGMQLGVLVLRHTDH